MQWASRVRSFGLARRGVRNADLGELQETFLIAGAVTILVIRTQLWATNYPQLGGHGLHIAHLLWGGLLMGAAIGILLTYLGRRVRHLAALIGGIGFGFFIDELGKFVTSDNNYFFKPAAAIIYTIFIGLFLLNRKMRSRRGLSSRERICNAIDLISEAARRDFDEREKHHALEMLSKADQRDPMVLPLRRLLEEIDAIPVPKPSFWTRRARAMRRRYLAVIKRPGFTRSIGLVFGLWAIFSLVETLVLVLVVGPQVHGVHQDAPRAFEGRVTYHLNHLFVTQLASVAVAVIAVALVTVGIIRLRHSRLAAYDVFALAVSIEIYIGTVFSFVDSQFTAVFALGIDILLLITLRYMIRRERQLNRQAARAETPPVPAAPESLLART